MSLECSQEGKLRQGAWMGRSVLPDFANSDSFFTRIYSCQKNDPKIRNRGKRFLGVLSV